MNASTESAASSGATTRFPVYSNRDHEGHMLAGAAIAITALREDAVSRIALGLLRGHGQSSFSQIRVENELNERLLYVVDF
ncbi:hypothetical protein [Bythopirellula polymerisocia]|nr:hypothetical protein [Bythopirellula polymerisocia]